MRFADPLTANCPACGQEGSYATRELLALSARCRHCAASLEPVGKGMRAKLAEVGAEIATIEMALELEDLFGVTLADSDLDAIQRPADFAPLLRESAPGRNVEEGLLAALTRAAQRSVEESDLHRSFAELFPYIED